MDTSHSRAFTSGEKCGNTTKVRLQSLRPRYTPGGRVCRPHPLIVPLPHASTLCSALRTPDCCPLVALPSAPAAPLAAGLHDLLPPSLLSSARDVLHSRTCFPLAWNLLPSLPKCYFLCDTPFSTTLARVSYWKSLFLIYFLPVLLTSSTLYILFIVFMR